ncbi:MAG: hypothetical protein RMJ52_12220 [Gemmataceae bacterium]|nr:hypothetical protein [Gemmataceae bacterium]
MKQGQIFSAFLSQRISSRRKRLNPERIRFTIQYRLASLGWSARPGFPADTL